MLCALPLFLIAQETSSESENESSVLPKISLSANPAGFLFFGPTIDLGIGITPNTAVTVHTRFVPYGLASRSLKTYEDESLDIFTGTGVGLGIIHFLNKGGEGFYVGGQVEYARFFTTHEIGDPWEWYEQGASTIVSGNCGYRKNITPLIYVNLGCGAGAIRTIYDWEYEDPAIGVNDLVPRRKSTFRPGGQVEIACGFRIK